MVHGSGTMDDDRFRAPGAPDPVPPAPQPGWIPPGEPVRPAAPPPPARLAGDPARLDAARRRAHRGDGASCAIAGVVLAAVVVFSLGVSVGTAGSGSGSPGTPAYSPSAERPDWRLLDEAYDLLDQHYVDPTALDPLVLERGAIDGMTGILDDRGHTGYLTPDEVKSRDESLSGTFVGVGAVLDQQDGSLVIVRVLNDSPAEAAGVKAGDEILTVDGVGVAGLTVDDVVDRVRGPEGSDVTLELKSPDGVTRTVDDHARQAGPAAGVVGLRTRDEERRHPPRVVLVGRREGGHRGAPAGPRPGRQGRGPRPARQPRRLRQRAGGDREPVHGEGRRLPLRRSQRQGDGPRGAGEPAGAGPAARRPRRTTRPRAPRRS